MTTMNLSKQTRLLVIGAHADDSVLCAGATMSLVHRVGGNVYDLTFSIHRGVGKNFTDRDSITEEHKAALRRIRGGDIEKKSKRFTLNLHDYEACNGNFQYSTDAIRKVMETVRDEFAPNLVITHNRMDSNQDHVTIYEEAYRTFKKQSSLLTFDFIPNTMRTNKAVVLVQVLWEDIERKCRALGRYKSQLRVDHPYMYRNYTIMQSKMCGVGAGLDFAEAFHPEIIRLEE